jgi:hypothetical protein
VGRRVAASTDGDELQEFGEFGEFDGVGRVHFGVALRPGYVRWVHEVQRNDDGSDGFMRVLTAMSGKPATECPTRPGPKVRAPYRRPGRHRPSEPSPPRTGRVVSRTRARHADVHRLLAWGRSLAQIAQELFLSRDTVCRFARADSPEELLVNDGTGRQASILDEHAGYLRERWNARCANAALLHQELRERGCSGASPRRVGCQTRGPAPKVQPTPGTSR